MCGGLRVLDVSDVWSGTSSKCLQLAVAGVKDHGGWRARAGWFFRQQCLPKLGSGLAGNQGEAYNFGVVEDWLQRDCVLAWMCIL